MRTTRLIAVIAVFLAGALACGGEKKPAASLDGVWKNLQPPKRPEYIRVEGDKVTLDRSAVYYVAFDQRDGKTVARIAGTDEVLFAATVLDPDRIDCYFPYQRATPSFERAREVAADIIGAWLFEDLGGKHKPVTMIIGEDSFQEGKRDPEPAVIEKHADGFRITIPKEPDIAIILKPDGRGGLDGRIEDDGEVKVRFHATRSTAP